MSIEAGSKRLWAIAVAGNWHCTSKPGIDLRLGQNDKYALERPKGGLAIGEPLETCAVIFLQICSGQDRHSGVAVSSAGSPPVFGRITPRIRQRPRNQSIDKSMAKSAVKSVTKSVTTFFYFGIP